MAHSETRQPRAAGVWQTMGHDATLTLLNRSITTNRLSHAHLFTGPASVGKHTLALDLARALNCTPEISIFSDQSQKPCGRCSSCDRISRAIHPDVRTIQTDTPSSRDSNPDAAARRTVIGIDLITDLQREAVLQPYEGKARVFIIREANRMSPEAANALLKTLEEPPPAVRFILTATSLAQLPETIASRCHHVSLRSVPAALIEAELCDRFNVPDNLSRTLAKMSQGAPGWAITALKDPSIVDAYDQSASRIISIIGSDLEQRFRYASDISAEFRRDRNATFSELERWLEVLRDIGYVKHGLISNVMFSGRLEQLQSLADKISDDQLAVSIAATLKARHALNVNVVASLAMELMMLEIAFASSQ